MCISSLSKKSAASADGTKLDESTTYIETLSDEDSSLSDATEDQSLAAPVNNFDDPPLNETRATSPSTTPTSFIGQVGTMPIIASVSVVCGSVLIAVGALSKAWSIRYGSSASDESWSWVLVSATSALAGACSIAALHYSKQTEPAAAVDSSWMQQMLDFFHLHGEKDMIHNTDINMEWREGSGGVSKLVPRFYESSRTTAQPSSTNKTSATSTTLPKATVTVAQVQSHCTADDLWVIIDGRAYDLTQLKDRHPGGRLPILNMAGQDCSEAFTEYHPDYVHKTMLAQYYVGHVSDHKVSELAQEHRRIRQELLRRGLFETNSRYYQVKGLWLLLLIVPSMVGVVCSDQGWVHMACAVGLAVFWQQLAFVGHDIGHNSITHHRASDDYYGSLLGVPLLGISLAWWKRSHNVHHIVCNSVSRDPDIQHQPIMAISNRMFGKFWSTYHEKYFTTDKLARGLISYQHLLFYPVMAVARVNLCIQGVITLLNFKEVVPNRWIELAGMCVFLSWQCALYCCLGSTLERVAFFFVSHAISGILHVQICISHFAMDVYHKHPYEEDDWFTVQLNTTMNVDCAHWLDWFHGGLQFQVEHHMFPRLPRHNLRKARTLVKNLCQERGLDYQEYTFWESNVRLVKQLRSVALDARKLKKGDGGFYETALWEGMNAIG